MRKENSEFKTKFISEPGSYLHNADYFAFVELKDYACYCIADVLIQTRKEKVPGQQLQQLLQRSPKTRESARVNSGSI